MTTWSDYPVTGEYVTEISVPDFGDGGIQRLHSEPLGGKGEREMDLHMTDAEYEKASAEWAAQYRAELDAMGVGGTVPIATVHPGDTWAHNQAVAAAEADGPEAESGA